MRRQGSYQRSLDVLRTLKTKGKNNPTKSGLMIGFGESTEQILSTLRDLRAAGVDFLTIGQYLQPTRNHMAVNKYYTPEEFAELKTAALTMGFTHVESGPLVRSAYHAQGALRGSQM